MDKLTIKSRKVMDPSVVTATIKVLLVGDSGVGKSSLLLSFTSGKFEENMASTIGIDFKVKKVTVTDESTGIKHTVNMQLWDTAGQERFRTLTSSYYRGAHAVVLVYDVNNSSSFQGIQKWMQEANVYCRSSSTIDAIYLLVGNKVDLCEGNNMSVSQNEAEEFARKHQMLFALTSAKTHIGISDAFDEVVRKVCDQFPLTFAEATHKLNFSDDASSSFKGGCC